MYEMLPKMEWKNVHDPHLSVSKTVTFNESRQLKGKRHSALKKSDRRTVCLNFTALIHTLDTLNFSGMSGH